MFENMFHSEKIKVSRVWHKIVPTRTQRSWVCAAFMFKALSTIQPIKPEVWPMWMNPNMISKCLSKAIRICQYPRARSGSGIHTLEQTTPDTTPVAVAWI